jgi:hypothetical protein
MARWRWLLAAALAASAISCVARVQAEKEDQSEGPIPIDEVPAPARDAILTHAGGGQVMEVHRETWAGQPMYEGHIRQGKREGIVWVDAEGHVLHKH